MQLYQKLGQTSIDSRTPDVAKAKHEERERHPFVELYYQNRVCGRALPDLFPLFLVLPSHGYSHRYTCFSFYLLLTLFIAGGYNALADIHGGAQQDRVIGGTQSVSIAMAKYCIFGYRLHACTYLYLSARDLGSRVLFNAPVRKITQVCVSLSSS